MIMQMFFESLISLFVKEIFEIHLDVWCYLHLCNQIKASGI